MGFATGKIIRETLLHVFLQGLSTESLDVPSPFVILSTICKAFPKPEALNPLVGKRCLIFSGHRPSNRWRPTEMVFGSLGVLVTGFLVTELDLSYHIVTT